MKISKLIFSLLIVIFFTGSVWCQSILPGAPAGYGNTSFNPAPSNPLGLPTAYGGPSSDLIPITSGMLGSYLPTLPNLEFGFQYFFGSKVRSGQFTADYLLPLEVGQDAVIFGEAHANWWDFFKRSSRSTTTGVNVPFNGGLLAGQLLTDESATLSRVDLSLGGGFRKLFSQQLLLGINGFYDNSRLFGKWYSSGSVGLELAGNVGTSDAVDLNFNWYGNILSSNAILNAFRNHGGSYDIEAGYSHALFDQAFDLRFKLAGYQFNVGDNVYGYRTGADLTTRDGMFTLRYEYGNDRINGAWNNVGAFVNLGFQPENLVRGESPFTMPEPLFKSPRNLRRMLTQKVKRNWNQPASVIGATNAIATPTGPWFRFSVTSSPYPWTEPTIMWSETETYIYVRPENIPSQYPARACTDWFGHSFSINVENYSGAGPINVRMTNTTSTDPGGTVCRMTAIWVPGGKISSNETASRTFSIPATGLNNYVGSWPDWTFVAYYRDVCSVCVAPVVNGALVGIITIEDLGGVIPTQTIHFYTMQ